MHERSIRVNVYLKSEDKIHDVPNIEADGTPGRRRRGAELQAVLLEAAWQELRAVGYHELTYDAVAARAPDEQNGALSPLAAPT